MTRFDPKDIASWSKGAWQNNKTPESIFGFCFDARLLKSGECFVALTCGARDGHTFVQQALDAGAGSLLVEQPQETQAPQLVVNDSLVAMGAIATGVRRQFSIPVVGITGSCGKTSTKEMLRILLGGERAYATPGNWNNRIGVPMTLFGLNCSEHDFAVVEAGINQPGEMSVLGSIIQADLTIVTNIGPAHLELLGFVENIAAEKSFLTAHSKADAPVILPNSVVEYPAFSKYANRAYVLAEADEIVRCKPECVIRYTIEISGSGYSRLSLYEGSAKKVFKIASPSRGICTNAALAIVAARQLGISDTEIAERLQTWSPAANRGRIEKYGNQTFYIDCYNANPASMSDAIAAFCCSAPFDEPRCYVLGTMNELGEDAAEMHYELGRKLELRRDDKVFFVGSEVLARAYAEGAMEQGIEPGQIETAVDVEAIQLKVANFSGSIFLKGSRSHQLEDILPEAIASNAKF